MSVSYSAKMAVGVIVDPEEFFWDKQEVTEVLCAHPEAEAKGVKFCPSCGLAKKDRVKVTVKRVLKPQFMGMKDFLGDDEEESDFPNDCPYPIAGLKLIQLRYDYSGSTYLLGAEIGRVGEYTSAIIHEGTKTTAATIDRVKARLAALGIQEEPMTFLAMSVS